MLPGNVHTLAMGLQHQVTPRQSEVSSQPWTLGSGRFFHHLNQNLLTRFKKFSNPGRTFLQAQRPEISDVDETIFLAFTDVDEGSINTGQNILNRFLSRHLRSDSGPARR